MTKPKPKSATGSPEAGESPERFEDVIDQLESLVENIESGEIGLEEAIDAYERGNHLVSKARSMLATAEQRVEAIDAKALANTPKDDDA
jgi:exodeoxyribonuclease VII small subunit